MERRKFIRYVGVLGTLTALMPELIGCESDKKSISTKRIGADHQRGHLLRDGNNLAAHFPLRKAQLKTAIIGGGMSGLATAYHLKRLGETDFQLFELANQVGGNSSSGENKYSKYPLGAHYLSLANPKNTHLIEFLKELNLIVGFEAGKAVYNEDYLCHAPDERLLYKGLFHEGLIPEYGVSQEINDEIKRFLSWMAQEKTALDEANHDLFHIPLSYSSESSELLEYDKMTFSELLAKKGFKSEELLWFLDYCCRDDYGAGSDTVSAWAGIHYFAGRKANPANTDPTTVLTWAEGNGFLVNKLVTKVKEHVNCSCLVESVEELDEHVIIRYTDFVRKERVELIAEQAVFAGPSYVAKHVLKSKYWPSYFFEGRKHHPWLIGIVTLKEIPESNGTPLAWDNVKFGTKGLGYVSNRHQEFKQHLDKYVLNVYLALDQNDPVTERRLLFEMSDEQMRRLVLQELESIHPTIAEQIESIDVQRWGHGMITPYPGTFSKYLEYKILDKAARRIHLAHTDYSGYSVFEEAFDLGFLAAQKITQA